LGINKRLHDAQRLGLIGQDPPSGVDEVAPPWVWLEGARVDAGGAAAPPARPRGRPAEGWTSRVRERDGPR